MTRARKASPTYVKVFRDWQEDRDGDDATVFIKGVAAYHLMQGNKALAAAAGTPWENRVTLQSFLNVANCEPQDHVHRIRVPVLYMVNEADPFAAPLAAHRVIFGRMGGNAESRVISRKPDGDLQQQLDEGVSAQSDHFRDNIDSETHITATRLRGQQYVIAARSSTDHGASMPTPTREDDVRELLKLNEDYVSSDQNRNVVRYEEFLATTVSGGASART